MATKKHKRRTYGPIRVRDLAYMKPSNYVNHMTLSEVAREIGCDPSWIRKLERADRIPKAVRVQRGAISVRLWSPEQVEEIREIIDSHQPGRPPKEVEWSGGKRK
jgi:hypothetical protein